MASVGEFASESVSVAAGKGRARYPMGFGSTAQLPVHSNIGDADADEEAHVYNDEQDLVPTLPHPLEHTVPIPVPVPQRSTVTRSPHTGPGLLTPVPIPMNRPIPVSSHVHSSGTGNLVDSYNDAHRHGRDRDRPHSSQRRHRVRSGNSRHQQFVRPKSTRPAPGITASPIRNHATPYVPVPIGDGDGFMSDLTPTAVNTEEEGVAETNFYK